MGLETSTWRRETTATVGGNIRSHFGSRPSNHTFLRLSVLHCLSISRLGSAMSALTDFFSSLRKVATDHDLTDIISDLAYHGGSPMQVREYMISCCANEASKDITKDLLVMAIVTLQFGTKPISDGLQAKKSSKYHNTAKQLMSWAKEKFSQYKENNLVPGLTANSLAAAVPELCVMYAGLSGIVTTSSLGRNTRQVGRTRSLSCEPKRHIHWSRANRRSSSAQPANDKISLRLRLIRRGWWEFANLWCLQYHQRVFDRLRDCRFRFWSLSWGGRQGRFCLCIDPCRTEFTSSIGHTGDRRISESCTSSESSHCVPRFSHSRRGSENSDWKVKKGLDDNQELVDNNKKRFLKIVPKKKYIWKWIPPGVGHQWLHFGRIEKIRSFLIGSWALSILVSIHEFYLFVRISSKTCLCFFLVPSFSWN